jgi:F-type H+-transporting ATPase subunit a
MIMKQDQVDQITALSAPDISSAVSLQQTKSLNGTHHQYGIDQKTEHVPLAPQVVFHVGDFPVTNSLIFSIVVTLFISFFVILLSRCITQIPGKIQALVEIVIEYIYNLGEELAHDKIKTFFPWVATFFIFVLTANILALFPGVSTIGINEVIDGKQKFIPLLRSINSDLNMTLSLALLSVIVTHFYAIKFMGIVNYFKKWFSLKMFGIFLFVGMLEVVSEFTKIVSLSFRLFGNILAGKVLLKTAWSYSAFIVPIPFYFLELIVAVVQAAVFMMLTLVFMVMLSEIHEN